MTSTDTLSGPARTASTAGPASNAGPTGPESRLDVERPSGAGRAVPASVPASLGLAVLRVVLGITFIAHGYQKIVTNGLAATTEGFAGMGVPLAEVLAPATAFVEVLAGAALVIGLLTRLAAAGLAVVSLVALVLVHLPAGFYAADGGIELVLLLAAAAVALVLTGAGRLSLDALIRSRRSGLRSA